MIARAGAAAIVLLLLAACGPMVPNFDELTQVSFMRGLTVESADDLHLQDDAQQVAAFAALLTDHHIDTSSYETASTEECPQGVTFRVEGLYGDTGYGFGMGIRDCGDSDGSFEAEAVAMLTGWLIEQNG